MRRCLVLVGPPAAGKSTVGALLAERLELAFIDVDHAVEAGAKRSIPEIFATEGEAHFRLLEHQETAKALARPAVVALGGGSVLNPRIRAALAGHLVVWLHISAEEATLRVGTNRHRPLLRGDVQARLSRLIDEREPYYAEVASLKIDTSHRTPAWVVRRIIDQLPHQEPERGNMTQIMISAERPYPVRIGSGVSRQLAGYLGPANRVAIIHPAVLLLQAGHLAEHAREAGVEPHLIEVPSGEHAKTPAVLESCWRELAQARFTRTDAVVGLGGGATTDLAGFVAASWLRGVNFINVPTTILGMVDAAVGGKTGIDLPEGKNLVGAFHEPLAVLADLDLLAGLPDSQVRSGMAELVKAGFIYDEQILRIVEEDPQDALDVTSDRCANLIARAIQVKADVVDADLREQTSTGRALGRELLNYGHTFGHAVEAAEKYRLSHGECVSIGMVFAAELSARTLGTSRELVDRHRAVLESLGLPVSYRGAGWAELRERMSLDKKSRGSVLRFVCLHDIGEAEIVAAPDEGILFDTFTAILRQD